jgi:D-beta-D-heptose 7-phosphate kinase/D-beta-D-heptose 1-phosphate adenosyltransferase
MDREDAGLPSASAIERMEGQIKGMIKDASAVIVSDYAKGAIGPEVIDTIREKAKAKGVHWVVDPKPGHKDLYAGASALTPNMAELSGLAAMSVKTDEEVAEASKKLVTELGLAGLLVTRSEKGMMLVVPDDKAQFIWTIPTEAREVFDVSGAGDTVIAAFTAAIAAETAWSIAAMLANAAAGVVVGKMGTATAKPQEILDILN